MKRNKQVHKPRKERQNDIILTAWSMWVDGGKSFTNAKMAKRLGLSASSKLKSMIDELVEEGWLQRAEKIHRSSWHKDGYKLEIKKHVYWLSVQGQEAMAII